MNLPSFNYKTSPFIYYPESISVDTHECTIETLSENDQPIKGMSKCITCVSNSQTSADDSGTQFISFDNVKIFANKDMSIDFWFNTTSNDYSRVIDFTFARQEQGISYSSNHECGRIYPTSGTSTWPFSRRGYWNHFCWQYNSRMKMLRMILNGKIEQETTIDVEDHDFPYAFLGKSAYVADPIINCRYTGIRIQYDSLALDNLTPKILKYSNTIYNELSITDS